MLGDPFTNGVLGVLQRLAHRGLPSGVRAQPDWHLSRYFHSPTGAVTLPNLPVFDLCNIDHLANGQERAIQIGAGESANDLFLVERP